MENKTLSARCANPACGKEQSTELMSGLTVGTIGHRRQITVCAACVGAGWRPSAETTARESNP